MDQRRVRPGLVALLSLALLGVMSPAGASARPTTSPAPSRGSFGRRPLGEQRLTTHRLVVDFGEGVTAASVRRDEIGHLSDVAGVSVRYVRETSTGSFVVAVPAGADAAAAARDLESSGAVACAEPDYIAVPLAVPNDPRFGEQWN
ncbi:MAG: hypothetical protein QOI55_1338, partial [Actinomycetota bacterium]|nr:hypothetical protein [Actinomycetota bacterium]